MAHESWLMLFVRIGVCLFVSVCLCVIVCMCVLMLGCSVVQFCLCGAGVWRHMPANNTEYTNKNMPKPKDYHQFN